VFGRLLQQSGPYGLDRGDERRYLRDTDPMNISRRGCRRNLWSVVRPNFCPAATHLRHLSALAVHGSAACAFFAAHRATRDTGQKRRRCSEQKEDCDDAGEAAHRQIQYIALNAEFGADGVGDGVGVVAHEGFGFSFDHDAGEGLGAAVANDDAAGIG
jgi:hypothetical protein